nr:MAG TPA: hypothetical protein [Caudoviricetes sp.]
MRGGGAEAPPLREVRRGGRIVTPVCALASQ